MKKKLFICALATVLLTGCSNKVSQLSNGEDALVSFDDGTKISVNEIWNDIKNTYGLDTLLVKIDNKILESEFADQKESVDAYISNYEASMKANYVNDKGEFDEEKMNSTLKQYGYSSLEDLLKKQRTSYLTNLAAEKYAKDKIEEKDIKKYYKENTVGDVSALHILVKADSNDATSDATALNKAKEILSKINEDVKNGTSKEDAFKKYESDTSVTYQNLGYFNKGDMVEPFEKAVYSMKKGEISKEPVKTTYGYHIILKLDELEKPSYDDAKENIKNTLAKENVSKDSTISTNAMIELRKKYGVKIEDTDINNAYNKYMNYLVNQK